MNNWFSEENLQGSQVKLVPLDKSHKERLVDAANDGDLWKLWYTGVPSAETIDQYLEVALQQKQMQQSQPFVVICQHTGKLLGSTRFCRMEVHNKRLEIGYTWYRKSVQRSAVNTETKLLLLSHAFESKKVNAVEFRTHWMNFASRKAIAGLGAKQDGVLRSHVVLADGSVRDTVIFSIIRAEWPMVKNHLQFRLENYLS